MALTSKKRARPTTKSPKEGADPLGLLPSRYIAKLKEAYYARLHAFLGRNHSSSDDSRRPRVGTSWRGHGPGTPVSFDLMITVYPRDATGFARAVGALETPVAEPSDEISPTRSPTIRRRVLTTIFGEQFGCPDPSGGGERPTQRWPSPIRISLDPKTAAEGLADRRSQIRDRRLAGFRPALARRPAALGVSAAACSTSHRVTGSARWCESVHRQRDRIRRRPPRSTSRSGGAERHGRRTRWTASTAVLQRQARSLRRRQPSLRRR